MKVWDQAEIELMTPGSAVRPVSAARHITNCATWPGVNGSDGITNNVHCDKTVSLCLNIRLSIMVVDAMIDSISTIALGHKPKI